MGWLASLRLNGQAKRYARKLPSALRQGWGGSDRYTPGQIRAAAKKARLNPRYLPIGYAAYLRRDEYDGLLAELPVKLDYERAKTLFARFRPSNPASANAEIAISIPMRDL